VFLSKFVSCPTVSSSIYSCLSEVAIKRSGRWLSPVMTEGELNDGKSAYMVTLVDERDAPFDQIFTCRKCVIYISDGEIIYVLG